MLAVDISEAQFTIISSLERTASALSLVGISWILLTFLGSKHFHKPINRLVFYASLGNIFTSVATLISREGVTNPNGALCQLQAVLVQTFMPADALWTFVMAVNVYLTFFHRFNAERLRKLEKWYFLFCYGLPLVPGLIFIWIQRPSTGRVYGNATLWCWIGVKWDWWRLWAFYVPVWIFILATVGIYCRCGNVIISKRNELRNFKIPAPNPMPIIRDPFSAQESTQIRVDKHIVITESDNMDIDLEQLHRTPDGNVRRAPGTANYVNISASRSPRSENSMANTSWPEKSPIERQIEMNTSLRSPNPTSNMIPPPRRYAANEANSALLSYLKVSMLFFVVMMITWIPSSANRIFSTVNKAHANIPLNYIAAFVLPLQGFWNAVIYTITSWAAVKSLWRDIRERRYSGVGRLNTMAAAFSSESDQQPALSSRAGGNRADKYSETDSFTELHTRPGTSHTTRTESDHPTDHNGFSNLSGHSGVSALSV